MELVLVERRFAEPVSFEEIQALETAGAWCLQSYNVRFLQTLFSRDQKRMLCLYEAPDAEAVRLAESQAKVPYDRAWTCQRLKPEKPVPGTLPAEYVVVERELYLVPVDYVSRSIVAISKRCDTYGRAFNLTNPHAIQLRELLGYLKIFDPTLQQVSYEEWRSRVDDCPGNALARYLPSFAERIPDDDAGVLRPRFDCEETLKIVEAAGIGRPRITQQFLETYFSYLASHTRSLVGARAK